MRNLDDGTDDETDGWMERTTLRGQNQIYYIRRYNHPNGNDPNEDLAKFGYMLKMKVAFLKNIFLYFWLQAKK
jgi:hypothetical protein